MIYKRLERTVQLGSSEMSEAYDGAGHDKCPPSGSRVGSSSLQHCHIVLQVLGIDGTSAVVINLLIDFILMLAHVALGLDLGLDGLLLRSGVAHVGGIDVRTNEQDKGISARALFQACNGRAGVGRKRAEQGAGAEAKLIKHEGIKGLLRGALSPFAKMSTHHCTTGDPSSNRGAKWWWWYSKVGGQDSVVAFSRALISPVTATPSCPLCSTFTALSLLRAFPRGSRATTLYAVGNKPN